MKYLILFFLMLFCSVGGYFVGFSQNKPVVAYGATQADLDAERAKRIQVMAAYFTDEARLKEVPTVDLALGNTQDWSDGYVQAANNLGVSLSGATTSTNITPLMQAKLGQQSELCSNPNSQVIGPLPDYAGGATTQVKTP